MRFAFARHMLTDGLLPTRFMVGPFLSYYGPKLGTLYGRKTLVLDSNSVIKFIPDISRIRLN